MSLNSTFLSYLILSRSYALTPSVYNPDIPRWKSKLLLSAIDTVNSRNTGWKRNSPAGRPDVCVTGELHSLLHQLFVLGAGVLLGSDGPVPLRHGHVTPLTQAPTTATRGQHPPPRTPTRCGDKTAEVGHEGINDTLYSRDVEGEINTHKAATYIRRLEKKPSIDNTPI